METAFPACGDTSISEPLNGEELRKHFLKSGVIFVHLSPAIPQAQGIGYMLSPRGTLISFLCS